MSERVIIVGGGVAGLAAADRLAAAGVEVTLLESTGRLGGKVRTVSFAGRSIDVGAEVLVARERTAIELCRELGLDHELVEPAVDGANVWIGDRLRPLPADVLTRLPGSVRGQLRSRLLSPRGTLRCGLDLVRPSHAPKGDVAIGAVVRARLGDEALDRLVDPLLGGIHAGRCDELSAQALMPQLLTALGTGKGIVRGLRAGRPARSPGAPFVSLRGGLGKLTDALGHRAERAGARMLVNAQAAAVEPFADGVRVHVGGQALDAAACVVAVPAPLAAGLLGAGAAMAATELSGIPHAPAAVVALAYPDAAVPRLPAGTGFVTAGDARTVRACTWASAKWEHLRGDPAIFKAFAGRSGSPPPADDHELVERVHRELAHVLSMRGRPTQWRVERYGDVIPQYTVGHLARVARIDAALPARVTLAGASYRGAGIAACIRSGRAGADRVLRLLGLSAP